MKKQIITGVICGGIGLLVGGKLVTRQITKILTSNEFKNKFVDELTKDFKVPMYKMEELVFDTIEDADKVITNLNELIDKYGYASVSDLYDLAGIMGSFKDNKYGWRSPVSTKIDTHKMGYILHIKKPELLK